MRANRKRLAAAVALGLATGCSGTSHRQPYADNPLLLSREPLTQTAPAAATKSQPAAEFQTTAGTSPAASRTGPPPAPPRPETSASANTVPNVDPPAPPIVPVSRTAPPEPVFTPSAPPANLPSPPPAPLPTAISKSRLDHAPDYSWLQGEFDIHYRGSKELRYCPASEEDPYGGKVRLVDDPRLAEFQPGDLIRVEGELVRDEGAAGQYPRFHVRAVRLIERRPAKN